MCLLISHRVQIDPSGDPRPPRDTRYHDLSRPPEYEWNLRARR